MPSRLRRLMIAQEEALTAGQAADEIDEPSLYTCEDCGKEFDTNRGLNMHITKVHAEGTEDGDDD